MCRLQYQTEHRRDQACSMCLSIAIIPILQWHSIDGTVWLKIPRHGPQWVPTWEEEPN